MTSGAPLTEIEQWTFDILNSPGSKCRRRIIVCPLDICTFERVTLFDRPNFRSGDTGPAMRSHCQREYIHPHALVTRFGFSSRTVVSSGNKATPAMRGNRQFLSLLLHLSDVLFPRDLVMYAAAAGKIPFTRHVKATTPLLMSSKSLAFRIHSFPQ